MKLNEVFYGSIGKHSIRYRLTEILLKMIFGMKVRKHDIEDMLKFDPKILEFHFSDSDLNIKLETNYDQQLIVHCYEYFEQKIIDMVSLEETNQIHSQNYSLSLIQKAIDKTVELGKHFEGKPTIIVHPGGYSLNELPSEKIQKMKDMLVDAVKQLDISKVNFLLENMPPYCWFYGGRWTSNMFLESDELIKYCKKTNLKICFDLCHSQMYCNKQNLSLINELDEVENFTTHYHLSDAEGDEGEGLQYGEGDIPFDKIIPILNKYKNKSFSIEVWKGHQHGGKGFKYFYDKLIENGMVVE
jgi:sugar phosphate isomerase/epimerase